LVSLKHDTPETKFFSKESSMKKISFILGFLICSFLPIQTFAITGLGIGIRGGLIQNYKNSNLNSLPTPKDFVKGMPMVGVHLKIGTLRIIHLEASLEYAWKKKEITVEDQVKADFTINDLSLNATAKYIFSFPVIKPYAGAGAGLHRLVYKISQGSYSLYLPENQNRWGFHGVAGLLFKFPMLPFELFGEGRYTIIQTKDKATRYTTILAGLTFNLP
jgi:opacity protein-like surface antigen